MGCPKHLQWSPIKEEPVAEELVEPSQKQNRGSLSSLGLKGKRQRKGGGGFSAFRRLLLSRTFYLLGLVFANVVRRFSF